jgi:hypothetical protein
MREKEGQKMCLKIVEIAQRPVVGEGNATALFRVVVVTALGVIVLAVAAFDQNARIKAIRPRGLVGPPPGGRTN